MSRPSPRAAKEAQTMAKKTAPFPTGEDLHALLVSRDKLDDLKTHTINYLTTLSQKAATPHGKKMYAKKIAELESNGFQPPRHVTLWGLHNVLADTNVGKLGCIRRCSKRFACAD